MGSHTGCKPGNKAELVLAHAFVLDEEALRPNEGAVATSTVAVVNGIACQRGRRGSHVFPFCNVINIHRANV